MSKYMEFTIADRGAGLVAVFQSENGGDKRGQAVTHPPAYNLQRLDQRISRLTKEHRDTTVERSARDDLAARLGAPATPACRC
jgi:hypothetical protein